PPERLERAGARRPITAGVRRRRKIGDPAAPGRALDLAAPLQGLLVAALAEVRDPRLPPARVLLRARRRDVGRRVRARRRGGGAPHPRQPDPGGDDRARRPAADLRLAVLALRD